MFMVRSMQEFPCARWVEARFKGLLQWLDRVRGSLEMASVPKRLRVHLCNPGSGRRNLLSVEAAATKTSFSAVSVPQLLLGAKSR